MSDQLSPVSVAAIADAPQSSLYDCLRQTEAIDDMHALSLHVAMLTLLMGELLERIENDDRNGYNRNFATRIAGAAVGGNG